MRTPIRRTTSVAALALAAVLALAACGGDDDSSSSDSGGGAYATPTAATTDTQATTGTTTAAGATTLELSAEPNGALAFDTDTLTAKAGEVTLDMANPDDAGIPHAIAVEGEGVDEDGEVAEPGGSSTVTATLKPGTYVFYCPVAGHREGGMKGTLTVN